MVLPLIAVVVAASKVAGVAGAGLAAKGGIDITLAQASIKAAKEAYDAERHVLEIHEQDTNEALRSLGLQQQLAIETVVDRMAAFLRRHQKQVSESEKLLVDGLESAPGQVTLEGRVGHDAASWMRGVLGSALAGAGVRGGLTQAVISYGAASTGTAISTLSGAAATNATLAALGGGSIASGGGGMAAGATVLNVVTLGPALLVTGFTVAGQGEKARTQAREVQAQVQIESAAMQLTRAKFDAIAARVDELDGLLGQLVARATHALDELESETFVPECHASRFQVALLLTLGVRDVAATQVVDQSSQLNTSTEGLAIRYRALLKETE